MRVRVFDSSYKALPAGVLGRLVVAVRRFRWTWIKQRWMRVVGQVVVIAFLAPEPPSVVTISGGQIPVNSCW